MKRAVDACQPFDDRWRHGLRSGEKAQVAALIGHLADTVFYTLDIGVADTAQADVSAVVEHGIDRAGLILKRPRLRHRTSPRHTASTARHNSLCLERESRPGK